MRRSELVTVPSFSPRRRRAARRERGEPYRSLPTRPRPRRRGMFSKHYTASANSVAVYACSDNFLIDLKHAVFMDVEASAIRQAEVGAAKTMLARTAEQFDVTPSELCRKIGDGVNQAADLISATASIPSLNFIPLTTFGNWF